MYNFTKGLHRLHSIQAVVGVSVRTMGPYPPDALVLWLCWSCTPDVRGSWLRNGSSGHRMRSRAFRFYYIDGKQAGKRIEGNEGWKAKGRGATSEEGGRNECMEFYIAMTGVDECLQDGLWKLGDRCSHTGHTTRTTRSPRSPHSLTTLTTLTTFTLVTQQLTTTHNNN